MTHSTITPAQSEDLARAVAAYLATLDAEPEKDCWDTETGEEEPGAQKFSSDWAWAECVQVKNAALVDLRAALAAQSAKPAAVPEALTRLAEIPPARGEERRAWLEIAEGLGFSKHCGGGLYTAFQDELLSLMSAARRQGQRDVLEVGSGAQQDAPVQWGDAKTVAGLIAQLRTLPPDAPIYGTFHGPDFPGEGRRRTGVRGVTLSRERVKGRWLSHDPDAELQHVIWTKPAQPEPTDPIPEPEIYRDVPEMGGDR